MILNGINKLSRISRMLRNTRCDLSSNYKKRLSTAIVALVWSKYR